MRGIAKEHLVGMHTCPLRPQTPCHMATQRSREPLHHDQPIAVMTVNNVSETPLPDQGETEDRPSPDPSVISRIVTTAMTKAPPMMAAQATADALLSLPSKCGPLLMGIVVNSTLVLPSVA
jgi:hypothetical protein